MNVEYIGLNTYLFIFPLEKKSLFDRVWEVQEELNKTIAMKHQQYLWLIKDENTGDYGFTNEDPTWNPWPVFDASFTPVMIFHDVFEHWFEGNHPYFEGENSFNIAGEVAAMGAMTYYYEEVYGRRLHPFSISAIDMTIDTTFGFMQENIEDGVGMFGDTFNCIIPPQPEVDKGDLERIIQEHWEKIQDLEFGGQVGQTYQDSITFQKLSNAYRWGYYMAQDMELDYGTVADMFDLFKGFCKNNDPEELSYYFDGMLVEYDSDTQEIKCTLKSSHPEEIEDVVLTHGGKIYPEDYFVLQDEQD